MRIPPKRVSAVDPGEDARTLDYAGKLLNEETVRSHLGKAILLTVLIPPVGVVALVFSLVAENRLEASDYSAAQRWGSLSACAGIAGILGAGLFALGIVLWCLAF